MRAGLDKQPADVAAMFDRVARRYDVTNTVLSGGLDASWRRATREANATPESARPSDNGSDEPSAAPSDAPEADAPARDYAPEAPSSDKPANDGQSDEYAPENL